MSLTEEDLRKIGIGFRRGDVVFIESQEPLSQATAELVSSYARDIYETTGVRVVVLDSNMKVSKVHRVESNKDDTGVQP